MFSFVCTAGVLDCCLRFWSVDYDVYDIDYEIDSTVSDMGMI